MSVTFGFYNSLNGDRRYDATQISDLFAGIINDGIFMSIGTSMIVTANEAMTVSVGVGRAWFNNTWTNNDAPLLLTAEAADLILPRIDAVVLEVNKTESVRFNAITVVKGVAATEPERPLMVNSDTVHQYPLCYIDVLPGVITINQGDITNMVGTSECPFITGILETINIDTLISQWEAQFNAWFETLEDVLDENVAANLLNMINQNVSDISDLNTQVEILSLKKDSGSTIYLYKNIGGSL